MKTVVRTDDCVAIHVDQSGPADGRVIMFANSLGTDLRVWDLVLPLLPQGLRIVRFDNRGHGLSDAPPAPYTIDRLVRDAETVCDALGLRDVTFVGLSIGGLIGQGLAAHRPDLVRALVLMDTAAKIGSPQMWDARIATIRDQGIAPLRDAIMERWFTPAFREEHSDYALWCNMLVNTPVEGYLGCCAAIAGADLRDVTRGLTLPVLAVAGDQDGSTPPALVEETAKLCGAQFHIIHDAGHIPCVEQPQATARILIDFIDRTAK